MRRNILTLTLAGGLTVGLASLTLAAGLALFMVLGRMGGALAAVGDNGLLYWALIVAFGVVAPALGLLAAWHGWRGLQGKPSLPFRLPGWGWLLLALVGALVAGQVLFSAGLGGLTVVAHVLVAVLAALMMLAIPVGAARRHGWSIGRRAGATSLSWGALGGIGLAVVLELLLVLALLAGIVAFFALTRPGYWQMLAERLRDLPMTPQVDPTQALAPLLRSPLTLLGGLLVMAVLIPLIEEAAKSLAVPFVRLAQRPLTRLDAFLIGAAAGAGFTLIEGITNGATALAQPAGWSTAMLARSGVAVIHVLASALAGLGWHAGLVERRWGRGLALFALAVALHGVWNGGALTVAWLGLRNLDRPTTMGMVVGSLGVLLVVGLLGLVFLGSLIALAVLPGRLAGQDQAGRCAVTQTPATQATDERGGA